MKHLIFLSMFFALETQAQTADDILNRCVQNIKDLRSISYNIYSETFGEKITAEVTLKRGDTNPIFEVALIKASGVALNDNGSTQISLAYNGSHFDYIDVSTNEMKRLDSPTYSTLSRTKMMLYTLVALPPYWQKEPFNELRKRMTSISRLEDTTVYGVECFKLKLTGEGLDRLAGKYTLESVWFIGKKDYLINGSRSKSDKQFLKIRAVNKDVDKNFFTLASSTEIKKFTGSEAFVDGLLAVGTKAPNWTLPSSKGGSITMDQLKGKVVLLDFWGTWCVPCIKAMPDIQAIHERFKTQAVEVMGVSVEMENGIDPVEFMKRKGFTYPTALDGHKITKDYKVQQFPTVYIIDKNGKVIHAEYGAMRENFREDLVSRIQNALK